ncbi:MAG: hypothetical protein EA425_09940 [Puniceicoccaceae bacterium]|nr:MAG: hypothetical protein EA425_09940 [Puniceicoccaceae bacterium]
MKPTPRLLRAALLATSAAFIPMACTSAPEAASSSDPAFIWWEGENPVETNFPERSAFSADTFADRRHEILSGGDWLSNSGDRAPGEPEAFARYHVEVPEAGSYQFWTRKFWKHGPFRWRFGEDDWRICGPDIALHDSTFIRTHLGANWVYLGEVELEAGTHDFELRLLAQEGEGKASAFDAFLLIDGPFVPRGKLRPDETVEAEKSGWFAWDPPADRFAESPLDLRRLNEPHAGIHGHVTRDGDRYLLGDGTPVRFWMTQASGLQEMRPAMVDHHTRRLAKYGVNLARLMLLDLFATWRRGDEEAFARDLDRIHYTVASFKNEGIYTFLGHLFWDTSVRAFHDDDLPGLRSGEAATTALFFNEPLREKYLEWIEALVSPVNPYTGLSLAEDPAVAFIEVQNESNTLFWTLNPANLPAHSADLIRHSFGRFAAERYGSLEAAFAHWGDTVEGDDPANGRAGFLGIWHLTTQATGNDRRVADQAEFLTRTQYDFYEYMIGRFHDLGIRSLISGSNWKTADPSNLGILEYYSYLPSDLVAKNEYFSPVQIENPRFFAVEEGDTFVSLSAMRAPEIAGVLMTAQPAGHTYGIIENNWDNPSIYRAEFPFLVATYGAMAGVDIWNFFSYDNQLWSAPKGVWNTNTTDVLGQYPAYALMFRRGDVATGPPAVVEHVNLDRLYRRDAIALPEIQYKDAVWQATLGGDPTVDFRSQLSPRAFFTGPVRLHFTDGEPSLETADLNRLIDEEARVIRNTNGQLEWHYGAGHVRVETPTSQGAAGFLAEAGRLEFSNLSLYSENSYGSLVAVALDDRPLAESARILIQAATRDQPHGYSTEPVGDDGAVRITTVGGYPLMVEKVRAEVVLKGRANARVTALDANGYPTNRSVRTENRGDDLWIELPADVLYTLVTPAGQD